MYEPTILAAIFATFLLAGAVKGVIGLGLPSVSLGLMTAAIDLPTAMALLLVPSFVTNFWQAVVGGHGRAILLRTWPFLLLAVSTIWLGAQALQTVKLSLLSTLLGVLLASYALISLSGVRFVLKPRQEIWAAPVLGAINGVFSGMTGAFAVPSVMFLQAIGMPRDMLVQAMGITFVVSTVALGFALQDQRILTPNLAILSAIAMAPAAIGMLLGQRIRRHMSEHVFRRAFFVGLLLLGSYIIVSATILDR